MAHKIRVFWTPHINKDGSESKTKKDWFFHDSSRHKSYTSPMFPTLKETEENVSVYRDRVQLSHEIRHPNDLRQRVEAK